MAISHFHLCIPNVDGWIGVITIDHSIPASDEDVSPHLLEWSSRTAPWGRPCYAFFRRVLPAAYRFLDMRTHAAGFRVGAAAYVSGSEDPGVRPADTRDLARAAGARYRIVAGAPHLGAIKSARREVIDLALATFERARNRFRPAVSGG